MSATPTESVGRVRSPSPPKVRSPVKVPERFKSPEPPVKSPEPPRSVLSPEPVLRNFKEQNGIMGKNMANGTATGNIKVPGSSTNQMESTDDQGLTRKKVIKVVRRVVRKVLPSDEGETTSPTQPLDKAPEASKPEAEPVKSKPNVTSAFSFKHDTIKTEDKDDISQGLTSLMVRGRTREPRPRLRKDEKLELEKNIEKKEEQVELQEKKQELQDPQKLNLEASTPGSGIQEVKSTVNQTSTTSERSAPTPSKFPHSRPMSLPPVVGFIPTPKPTPLSPPPGFIPAPKPTGAKKLTPVSTPSPTPVAQKSSPLPPSSRFIPASKPSPTATPVSSQPARPSHGPQYPLPAVIPSEQPDVSQQEV